jgi:hypothetical protein
VPLKWRMTAATVRPNMTARAALLAALLPYCLTALLPCFERGAAQTLQHKRSSTNAAPQAQRAFALALHRLTHGTGFDHMRP